MWTPLIVTKEKKNRFYLFRKQVSMFIKGEKREAKILFFFEKQTHTYTQGRKKDVLT